LVWFDKGEIGAWFQVDEQAIIASAQTTPGSDHQDMPDTSLRTPNFSCPRCQTKPDLSGTFLVDQTIYRCLDCLGHLITMEGLKRFKSYKSALPKPAIGSQRLKDRQPLALGIDLLGQGQVLIKQRKELVEFFGLETRNKYDIFGSHSKPIAFAAEQGKDASSIIFRNLFGH